MIGYAINSRGGWRRIGSEDDCLEGEVFSTMQPPIPATPIDESEDEISIESLSAKLQFFSEQLARLSTVKKAPKGQA